MNNFIQEGAIGVQIGMINQVEIVTSKNIWRSIIDGWYQILDMFLITKNSIKSSIMGSTNPQFQGPATMGPIGISQITGNIAVSNIEINTDKLRDIEPLPDNQKRLYDSSISLSTNFCSATFSNSSICFSLSYPPELEKTLLTNFLI